MPQPVSADSKDTMRDLRSGAPPSLVRIALVREVHEATVRMYSSRNKWPSPKLQQAEAYWLAGDVAGSIAETALALARANDANMERLLTLIMAGAGGAVGEAAFLAGPELEAALAASSGTQAGGEGESGADANLAHIAGLLSRQTGLILRAAEASGGILSKGQVDTLTALIRLAEKFESLGSARAAELQNKSDDELSDLHRIVDERIFELAYELAGRLVAEKPAGEGPGALVERLVPVGAAGPVSN